MVNKIQFTKKAFAFSFLALFLSIFIFAYASMFMFEGNFDKVTQFKEARINYVNNELFYFKNIYIKDSLSFSLYNTLSALLNYSKDPNVYSKLNKNYTYLNNLLYEGITNGSFDGIAQNSLSSKNLNYFVSDFSNNFYSNYKGNISFNILNLNIYEKVPYYVNIEFYSTINVSMLDNLSSWNDLYSFDLSIPIYQLNDPDFLFYENLSFSIMPVNLYKSNLDWSVSLFNETLQNSYSIIYSEPNHKYTLGKSFLRRLLNISESSYKDVLGFWSFDYDEYEGGVFDSSGHSNLSNHFGNTQLAMSFDEDTINSNLVSDLSVYRNNGIINGNVNCSISGVYNNGCGFDGNGDYISINSSTLDFSSNYSVGFWIKPNSNILNNSQGILIIKNDSLSNFVSNPSGLRFFLNGDNKLEFDIYPAEIGNLISNYSIDKWNYFVATFDSSTNQSKLYHNSVLVDSKNISMNFPNFLSLYISFKATDNYFNGSLDEVTIYSKVLSDKEVAMLFEEKKVEFIDYIDTLHGKGIEFDGEDDYTNISLKNLNLNSDYSIELWIKPYSYNLSNNQGILIFKNNSISNSPENYEGLRFFLNTNNELEFDIYPAEIGNLVSNYNLNKWNYYILTFNNSNNKVKLYHNSNLVNDATFDMSFINVKNMYLSFKFNQSYFKGIIDEVKIYNRTLSDLEIKSNYYNYDSNSKGCCNYLTLINPNLLGYNTSIYSDNVSYSSKLFYDNYKHSISYNMTLWNIINITSNDTSKEFYNFMVDACLISAFNIDGWNNESNVKQPYVKLGQYNNSCSNFVTAGIY